MLRVTDLIGLRSMEEALADLREKHRQRPTRALARIIEQLQAEIAIRKPA